MLNPHLETPYRNLYKIRPQTTAIHEWFYKTGAFEKQHSSNFITDIKPP